MLLTDESYFHHHCNMNMRDEHNRKKTAIWTNSGCLWLAVSRLQQKNCIANMHTSTFVYLSQVISHIFLYIMQGLLIIATKNLTLDEITNQT